MHQARWGKAKRDTVGFFSSFLVSTHSKIRIRIRASFSGVVVARRIYNI